MEFKWEDGFEIRVGVENDTAMIRANTAGLVSLANHLLALTQESAGSHIHLDAYNALTDDSVALIVEKAE